MADEQLRVPNIAGIYVASKVIKYNIEDDEMLKAFETEQRDLADLLETNFGLKRATGETSLLNCGVAAGEVYRGNDERTILLHMETKERASKADERNLVQSFVITGPEVNVRRVIEDGGLKNFYETERKFRQINWAYEFASKTS